MPQHALDVKMKWTLALLAVAWPSAASQPKFQTIGSVLSHVVSDRQHLRQSPFGNGQRFAPGNVGAAPGGFGQIPG